jgi:hypothetical protein
MDYTSMHDWFYGPSDPTWILPTYDDPIVPQRAAYEQQMPELPNRRAYVKAAAQSPPPPLPTTYYRLYPKVQTVTDGPPVRTVVEEPRDRVVEAGVPVVSQDAVRRESQLPPPPPPLKNLPIELKVPLCCEKCEKKVYDKLMDLSGVENVITDQYNQKVIVTGNVDPARVLNRVKHIKKRSVFWDQTVDYSQAYVRKQKERELAMIQAKKQQQQAESAAAAKRNKDKGPNMTVILPEHDDKSKMPYQTAAPASGDGGKGPNVTVILPESKPSQRPNVQVILPPESDATRRMDYQSDQARVHTERYESHLRGHSQEFYNRPPPRWDDERHQGRQPEHHDAPFNPNYNPNYL